VIRLALLFSHYLPYHNARVCALIHEKQVDVIPLQLYARDRYHNWRSGGPLRPDTIGGDTRCRSADVERMLDSVNPNVVAICGYSESGMRAAARWAKRQRRPTVLMFESTRMDRRRFFAAEAAKAMWLRRYVSAVFTGGGAQRAYALTLGVPASRIIDGYDVVDNNAFAPPSKALPLGAGERKRFLFVGRLVREKNIIGLCRSYEQYRDGGGTWSLRFVGDGPERHHAERLRTRFTDVGLAGYLPASEVPAAYHGASALVLPSLSEPWGLVVNEAAAAGLPLVVSQRCGCVTSLISRGVNGFDVDPVRSGDVAKAMLKLSTAGLEALREMGEWSRRLVARLTPQRWAAQMAKAVALGLAR
jgi:1,2-diacylglycerol 3-alpha-glucosyltransferase